MSAPDDDFDSAAQHHNDAVADQWQEGYGTATRPPYAPLNHTHTINIDAEDRAIEFPGHLPDPPGAATLRTFALIATVLFIVIEVCALAGLIAAYLNGWRP